MKYTAEYREPVVLADGTALLLRAIQPSDKAGLVEGFARLSVESRRRRFFTTKTALSEQELHYLTECDGINHFAIVALHDAGGPDQEGVGVARLVRLRETPQVAELAIVVLDDWQRRGIGSLLLERLIGAASERKVERIRAVALADNHEIRSLLARHAEDLEELNEDGLVQITIPVPPPGEADALASMLTLLGLAGLGTILVPIWLGRRSIDQLLSLARSPRSGRDQGS